MTKNYEDAVLEAETLNEYSSMRENIVEKMVAIGYRAGLADSVSAVQASAAAMKGEQPSTRLYAVLLDKIGSVARKFEDSAKKLGV